LTTEYTESTENADRGDMKSVQKVLLRLFWHKDEFAFHCFYCPLPSAFCPLPSAFCLLPSVGILPVTAWTFAVLLSLHRV